MEEERGGERCGVYGASAFLSAALIEEILRKGGEFVPESGGEKGGNFKDCPLRGNLRKQPSPDEGFSGRRREGLDQDVSSLTVLLGRKSEK